MKSDTALSSADETSISPDTHITAFTNPAVAATCSFLVCLILIRLIGVLRHQSALWSHSRKPQLGFLFLSLFVCLFFSLVCVIIAMPTVSTSLVYLGVVTARLGFRASLPDTPRWLVQLLHCFLQGQDTPFLSHTLYHTLRSLSEGQLITSTWFVSTRQASFHWRYVSQIWYSLWFDCRCVVFSINVTHRRVWETFLLDFRV